MLWKNAEMSKTGKSETKLDLLDTHGPSFREMIDRAPSPLSFKNGVGLFPLLFRKHGVPDRKERGPCYDMRYKTFQFCPCARIEKLIAHVTNYKSFSYNSPL